MKKVTVPKETAASLIPWKDIPMEFNWVAVDMVGSVYAYPTKPFLQERNWATDPGIFGEFCDCQKPLGFSVFRDIENWKELLFKRP